MRIRRSFLYTPGDRPDRMAKAATLAADSVVFDMEDAVAPASKAAARTHVAGAVKAAMALAKHPEICVRVNPAGGRYHEDDVKAVATMGAEAVVLPKAENPEDVRRLAHAVAGTPLIILIETAKGYLRAEALASCDQVAAIVFGSEDFAASVGMVRTIANTEILVPRATIAITAAACGIAAIDQVFIDFKDTAGLEREAREGRGLGYTGKQIIHPSQIDPVHRAFTPTKDQADRALALLEAARKAGVEDGGVFAYEGKMIDRPLVEQARQQVDLARHAGILP
ncbi:MAG: HpcH/HpaI aldolase/citrate lyase family protein [Thermoplasmatota archaeon]